MQQSCSYELTAAVGRHFPATGLSIRQFELCLVGRTTTRALEVNPDQNH
jgi:hypothetical protein